MEQSMLKEEELLKREGLKKTRGRNAVIEVLKASNRPMTYDEVYSALINNKVSVNVSTVYRILEMFFDKGIVSKLNGGESNRSLYELAGTEHRHYFFCVSCKEMYPISKCPISSFVKEIKNSMQFEVLDHKLEVSGICRNCRA